MYVNMYLCTVYVYMYVCNSLLIGLLKTRLSPFQTVLNAAARLIVRLPRYSHISSYMYIREHLHWLPILTRIEYKVLLIVIMAQMEWHLNISVTPSDFRPVPHPFVFFVSFDRRELFVPRPRTTTVWLNLDPFLLL